MRKEGSFYSLLTTHGFCDLTGLPRPEESRKRFFTCACPLSSDKKKVSKGPLPATYLCAEMVRLATHRAPDYGISKTLLDFSLPKHERGNALGLAPNLVPNELTIAL